MVFPNSLPKSAATSRSAAESTPRQGDGADCECIPTMPVETSPMLTRLEAAEPAPGATDARHDPTEPSPAVVRCETGSSKNDTPATRRRTHLKAALRYAIATAGCALFALIYAQFSHGVHSPFMTFMFGIPLVGGALPALCLALSSARPLPRTTRQSWALALAALTVASCLRGIFDIAGTASPYLVVYLAFAVICAIVAVCSMCKRPRKEMNRVPEE